MIAKVCNFIYMQNNTNGAEGRTRTDMSLHSVDFESTASTNFTTPADNINKTLYQNYCYKKIICFFGGEYNIYGMHLFVPIRSLRDGMDLYINTNSHRRCRSLRRKRCPTKISPHRRCGTNYIFKSFRFHTFGMEIKVVVAFST